MSALLNLDFFLTNFFNKLIPHNQFFNYFFSFFSLKGSSILIWLLIIFVVVIFEERKNPGISKRDKKFIILFSLAFLLTAFLTDIVLKNIFMRPRPFDFAQSKPFDFICPTDFSFPSTHAATAFTAAMILTFFDKKRRWLYLLVAILISYSRIYLSCHYFLDVVAGAFIGYIISRLLLYALCTSPFHRKN